MPRHIKNYSAVKRLMKQYFDKDEASAKKRLEQAENDLKECDGPESEIAERKRNVADRMEYLEKYLPRYKAQWEARLEAADKAGKLLEINIIVNWSRSRTWGMNPHAEAWVCFEDPEYGTRSAYGEDRASGCGYDKRSAAMSGALSLAFKKKDDEERKTSCMLGKASIDRFVIEHGEELWKEYAIDRTPFPHLCFGGKGSSCLTRLFRWIGCKHYDDVPVTDFVIDFRESDRGSDVYHIIRRDRI